MMGIKFRYTSNVVGICGGGKEPISEVVFPGGSNIPRIQSMWGPRCADGGIFKYECFCDIWGEGCLVVFKGTV